MDATRRHIEGMRKHCYVLLALGLVACGSPTGPSAMHSTTMRPVDAILVEQDGTLNASKRGEHAPAGDAPRLK